MYDIMYEKGTFGIGTNMVGVFKGIIVVDLQESLQKDSITMINSVITKKSQELQTFKEESLSYPGIKAMVKRSKEIEIEYLDISGKSNYMSAEVWLATIIQHEVDYPDGKVFLDYISPTKRKMLLKRWRSTLKIVNYK